MAANHHLYAKDFDALWEVTSPGATLVYWTSRSLCADCEDPLLGAKTNTPPSPQRRPKRTGSMLERDRARACRNWAQRHARAGEGYLTQRRSGDVFDYRLTRAHMVTPRRTWVKEQPDA